MYSGFPSGTLMYNTMYQTVFHKTMELVVKAVIRACFDPVLFRKRAMIFMIISTIITLPVAIVTISEAVE